MRADEAAEILKDTMEGQQDRKVASALDMAVQALTEWDRCLDIRYDYDALAKQYRGMIDKYETEAIPIREDGMFLCPACRRRVYETSSYCWHCGKRVGWGALLEKRTEKGRKPHTAKRKGGKK